MMKFFLIISIIVFLIGLASFLFVTFKLTQQLTVVLPSAKLSPKIMSSQPAIPSGPSQMAKLTVQKEVLVSPPQKEANGQTDKGETIFEEPNNEQAIREMIDALNVEKDELRTQRNLAWREFNQLQDEHAELQRESDRLDFEHKRLDELLETRIPKNPTKEQIETIRQSDAYQALEEVEEERRTLEKKIEEGNYFERWQKAYARADEAIAEIETINELITELKGMLP